MSCHTCSRRNTVVVLLARGACHDGMHVTHGEWLACHNSCQRSTQSWRHSWRFCGIVHLHGVCSCKGGACLSNTCCVHCAAMQHQGARFGRWQADQPGKRVAAGIPLTDSWPRLVTVDTQPLNPGCICMSHASYSPTAAVLSVLLGLVGSCLTV